MCAREGGQGASAATLDARVPGPGPRGILSGESGLGPLRRPPATPPGRGCAGGGPGRRAAAAVWGSGAAVLQSPPRPPGAGERWRESAGERWRAGKLSNNKLFHMTRNQESAGSEPSPNIYQTPSWFQSRAQSPGELGRVGSGPGCKVLPRKRVGKKAVAGGGWGGWRRQKLDRLGNLEERKKKEGILQAGATGTPRARRSEGGFPLETPGLASSAARPQAGPEGLTYFGAEVALGRAEGGERGGEREQGEQQAAGGPWGGRHGPRPSGQTGRAGSAAGPKPWGRAATPWGAFVFGRR